MCYFNGKVLVTHHVFYKIRLSQPRLSFYFIYLFFLQRIDPQRNRLAETKFALYSEGMPEAVLALLEEGLTKKSELLPCQAGH